jgi:hypothetical protein
MTINQQFLDPLPVLGVFAVFAIVALLAYEIGFRVGTWGQNRTPDAKEGPTGMLVGSLLGLLAFLLAVTMGMASDRFDSRRSLVLTEANSIGTTYLRAGFLPEAEADEVRSLLREYVPLRITSPDPAVFRANHARASEIQREIWAITEEQAESTPESEPLGLFIVSLNETIDLQAARATAIITARVPETILMLLFAAAALTMGVVGYSAGLTKTRGAVTAVLLVLVLGAVLTVVVDLDRPRDGFLLVSQQPLVDLGAQLGPP